MDLLLKFVLITVFAVNCYSYKIITHPQSDPEEVELQDIGYIADDYYPYEYIEKMMSKVSSEELEQLKINHSQTMLKHRFGSSPGNCKHTIENKYLLYAFDKNNIEYYVVQSPNKNDTRSYLQMFTIERCDTTNGPCGYNKKINPGSISCCKQQDEMVEMTVVSVPVREFKSNNADGPENRVQKKMKLPNAKCVCQEYAVDTSKKNASLMTCTRSKLDHPLH